MTAKDITNNGCWIVDRKISIGLILAIVVHALSVVGWLVRMESRIGELERVSSRHESSITDQQKLAISVEGMRSDISWIRENLSTRQK